MAVRGDLIAAPLTALKKSLLQVCKFQQKISTEYNSIHMKSGLLHLTGTTSLMIQKRYTTVRETALL